MPYIQQKSPAVSTMLVPMIYQQMSQFSQIWLPAVLTWVVAKLQICLQQHEIFNSQRAMQQSFPALCGSGLYFLF